MSTETVLHLQSKEVVGLSTSICSRWNRPRQGAGCEICRKRFRSLSTYLSHVGSRRHALKRARSLSVEIEHFDTEMSLKIAIKEPELCYSEALRMRSVNQKAAILLMWKAGKGYTKLSQMPNAIECFQKTLAMITDELAKDAIQKKKQEKDDNSSHHDLENVDSVQTTEEGPCSPTRKNLDIRVAANRWKIAYEKIKNIRDHPDDADSTSHHSSGNSSDETDDGMDEKKKKEYLDKRQMVLNELIETEESFLTNVQYIVEKIQPLFSLDTTSSSLKVNTASIFCNIIELFKFHSRFARDLKKCIEDVSEVGKLFIANETIFADIYSRYCRGKPNADDLMEENKDEIEHLFSTYLKGQRLNLNDFLIKPVQRLMKYQLLLDLIRKYTERSDEDHSDIKKAVDLMKVIPQTANNRMNIAMIIDYPKNINEDELILQDNLEVSFGRFKHKLRPCRVFLFKECLVVTEIVERQGRMSQYRFLCEGKNAKMGVTKTIHNDKQKFAVWFRKFGTTDIFVCKTECQQMKQNWLDAIREIVASNQDEDHDGVPPALQSSSIRRSQSWSANEFVRRATVGHPRREMSRKLKSNIAKFLTEEYHLHSPSSGDEADTSNEQKPQLHRYETFSGIKNSYENENVVKTLTRQNGEQEHVECEGSSEIEFKESFKKTESSEEDYNKKEKTNADDNNNSCPADETPVECINTSEHVQEISSSVGAINSPKDHHKTVSTPDCPSQLSTTSDERNQPVSDAIIDGLQGNFPSNAIHTQCGESSEILLLRSMESEIYYFLGQLASRSDKGTDAIPFYLKSFSLFFPCRDILNVSKSYTTRNDILKTLTTMYAKLKSSEGYICKTSPSIEDDDCVFFSYDGLKLLIDGFSRATEKIAAIRISTVLRASAVVMATTESHWDDAYVSYTELSRLFEKDDDKESAVDCLVDAYFVSLENGDMMIACTTLEHALQLAIDYGSKENIERVADIGVSLDSSLDHTGRLRDLIESIQSKAKEVKTR